MKTIEKRFISNLNEVKEKIISEVSMYDILDYYNTDIINNKSLCIFHEEENPSLSIYDEGEAFKCFSCGASGNVISYIMEKEDVGFIEAIELLANRNNIEINAINNLYFLSIIKHDKKKTANNAVQIIFSFNTIPIINDRLTSNNGLFTIYLITLLAVT